MSGEEKQVAGEEDQIVGSIDDNDQDLSIDVGSETSDYFSNDAHYSTSNIRTASETEFKSLEAEERQVEPNDVLKIEELSGEFSHEPSSSENSNMTVLYEYPSDFDEDCCGHVPQTYFDNTKNLPAQENMTVLNIKDITSLSENLQNKNEELIILRKTARRENSSDKKPEAISKAPDAVNTSYKDPNAVRFFSDVKLQEGCKINFEFTNTGHKNAHDVAVPRNLKFVDHSSDEFADIEDNTTDSVDSCSDSEFFAKTPASSSEKTMKNQLGNFPLDVKAKEGHAVEETGNSKALKEICKKCTGSASETHEENIPKHNPGCKNDPPNIFEPSFSDSAQNKSKNLKIPAAISTKEGKMAKKNLSTVLEIPELEENNQNLQMSQPSPSKNKKSLKMKTIRVGSRKDKCNVCNVRLGLCAIKCRCGGYYCAKHRYDKEHNCTFDYKSMGAEEIRKNNPRVIAEKVRKL